MPHLSIPSPLGDLTLFEDAGALVAIDLGHADGGEPSPLLERAASQLEAYFNGALRHFDLPLAPVGSAFQQKLWRALQQIPYGQTVSYGQLAHELNSGPRAVGGACGRNAVPIIIPCHRVLAAGGAMGGYSGMDGLETKRFLLQLEGAL